MKRVIYADGIIGEIEDESFEKYQEIVGGYIQIIKVTDGINMVINEEGRLLNLPVNRKATDFLQAHTNQKVVDIVGNVVLIERRRKERPDIDKVIAEWKKRKK